MEEELFESLDGFFVNTIYRGDSYMVSRFECEEGTITVTGPSFDYVKGEKYTITGNYVDHPRYGFQFNMINIRKFIPNKKDEIIKYLSSSSFKGVGKKAASKIYDAFGDECLRIIKDDISVLDDLKLTEKQFLAIKNGLEMLSDDSNETIFLLVTAGFSNSEANRIYNYYKENTAFVVKDNPFRIYIDVYGISFNKILQCSKGIEFDNKEFKFKEAFLLYLFKEISFRTGNIYLDYVEIYNEYSKQYHDFNEILDICLKDEIFFEEDGHYYLKNDYYDEKYIADYLTTKKESLIIDDANLIEAINDYEKVIDIKYDEYQIEALKSFFLKDFSIVVGGPGTGKTTLIKSMVDIFKDFFPYNNIMVVAPTGRAAKRINEMCDVESKTIHSLLKWNKETNTFIHKIDNPILYDCIIIDEFSMVDNNLFASLLKASLYVKKICIIGDNNQLPSIRQGNVLKDLIESNIFNVTVLKNNHRQKNGNDIIELAYDIVNNSVDFNKYKNDIEFYDINTTTTIDLVDMINSNLCDGYSLDDIQVLSPMYRGDFGIDNLNNILQSSFNPKDIKKKERKIGKNIFRENDKILQLKNRPNDDVYNGDIGILEEINEDEKCLVVNYQDVIVFYNNDDVNDISLAYSLSVHKAQGSEYKIVYFIVSRQHINMLYKKLIYTAISRAKIKLVIIGDPNAFINGVVKELGQRKTSLIRRLTEK